MWLKLTVSSDLNVSGHTRTQRFCVFTEMHLCNICQNRKSPSCDTRQEVPMTLLVSGWNPFLQVSDDIIWSVWNYGIGLRRCLSSKLISLSRIYRSSMTFIEVGICCYRCLQMSISSVWSWCKLALVNRKLISAFRAIICWLPQKQNCGLRCKRLSLNICRYHLFSVTVWSFILSTENVYIRGFFLSRINIYSSPR